MVCPTRWEFLTAAFCKHICTMEEPTCTGKGNVRYAPPRLTIPQWAASDRPREKYLTYGGRYVSDAELVAILLRNGSRDESAVELAKRLLADNENSLNQLAEMSVDELVRVNGIGKVKAITLHAAFELGRRRRAEGVEQAGKITCMEDVVALMQSKLAELDHEEFWVIYVNNANIILKVEQVGSGGLTSTIVDVRNIIRTAVFVSATGLFLCHNHPSGKLKPSENDILLTQKIRKASEMFDIHVTDHIIIHKEESFSFFAEGLL